MYFIERERFPFVHLLPRWLQKLVWNRLKPEAWKFIPVSHFGSRGPSNWGIFYCLPRSINKDLDWKQISQEMNQYFNMGY